VARNRKRARKRSDADPLGHDALESGDEQIAEAQAALGRPDPSEVPSQSELTAFEESAAGGDHPATTGGRTPGVRGPGTLVRLVEFLRGSWRELQRVQWPDRRQVFQATGVVLGFVIVAGAFLGVASFAAQKIVNLILYGHG
jgi:preprotein translocase subunit SecE